MDSKKRYGSPKITKVLISKGLIVSQKRVARRMKCLGISSIILKKYKPCSAAPSLKWVGDITYIYTQKDGWTYLATVMDLFDLKIIGYCYSKRMTSYIASAALNMAVANRSITDNTIFHSDLGSQYTSNDYESLLKNFQITHSYSRKGCPYDNASMESFNSILKKRIGLYLFLL